MERAYGSDLLCREVDAIKGGLLCRSVTGLLRQMRNLLKKTPHASEQLRPTTNAHRQTWFDGQLNLDPERLIFINETGTNTKMARLCGRAVQKDQTRI